MSGGDSGFSTAVLFNGKTLATCANLNIPGVNLKGKKKNKWAMLILIMHYI